MKKINNIQTKDFIAEAIRNEILAGNMKEGEELTQEALAETLAVSRMPVREALQTLVQEGFLKRLPNRHMQVVALDEVQIKETFSIISSMESEIIEILINKEFDTNELSHISKQLNDTDDKSQIINLELKFHTVLTTHLNNQYIFQIYSKLMNGYVSYAIKNHGMKQESKQHLLSIISAISNNDVSKVKSLFYEYYMHLSKVFNK